MPQLEKASHTYIFRDEDGDKSVDDECVKKLSEAHWPKLTSLQLRYCSLKGTSCKWIAKTWPYLTKLDLGKKKNTQTTIILRIKVASIWLRQTGHSLNIFGCVTI